MPPLVAAAAISGIAAVGGQVLGSRSAAGANKRAIAAQQTAAQRAEAFERDQDAKNRADEARRDAEDKRRWEVEQANVARTQAEQDARQRYIDQQQYQKRLNIARLTGQPPPPPLPDFGGGAGGAGAYAPAPVSKPMSAPIMSAPSRANAMIAAPVDPMFNPLAELPQARMPLSRLAGRRY